MKSISQSRMMIFVLIICELLIPTVQSICPVSCTCSPDHKTVNCDNKKFKNIPDNIPSEVENLFLNGNLLTNLTDNVFSEFRYLNILQMKNNKIMNISPLAFKNLNNLLQLHLEGNNIVKIENGSFQDLDHLTELIIAENHLVEIPNAIILLINLKTINLSSNKITKAALPAGIKNLKHLTEFSMNVNPLHKIESSDFDEIRNSQLVTLSLSDCQLFSIEVGTFKNLPHLQSFTLSFNSLNEIMVRSVLTDLKSSNGLQSLDISSLIINSTLTNSTFKDISNRLLHLFISHNSINDIENGTFHSFTKLQSLDLSHNNLNFSNVSNILTMKSLKDFKMSHNLLSSIPFGLPESLTTDLDLSFNSISVLNNNSFKNLSRLISLKLNNNQLEQLNSFSFNGLTNLKVLDLSNNQISKCDNSAFKPLNNLNSLNLHSNNFFLVSQKTNLFESVDKLTLLDFSSNNLSVLSPEMFKGLKTLKNLSLKQNLISAIPLGLFEDQAKVEYLDLSDNLITSFYSSFFVGLKNLKLLNLLRNPFFCSCDLLTFHNWINKTNITLLSFDNYICESPTEWTGKKIIDFLHTNDCSKSVKYNWILSILTPTLCSCLVVFIILSFLFYFRWDIMYLLYLKKKHDKKDLQSLFIEEIEFDFFISCSRKDEEMVWSLKQFLENINNAGKVLNIVSYMNFSSGKSQLENLHSFVNKSEKIIIVLTKNYIKSSFSKIEMKLILKCKRPSDIIIINELVPIYCKVLENKGKKIDCSSIENEDFQSKLYKALTLPE